MDEDNHTNSDKENHQANRLPPIKNQAIHKKTFSEPNLRKLNQLPPIRLDHKKSLKRALHTGSPKTKKRRLSKTDKLNLLHPLKQIRRVIKPNSNTAPTTNKTIQENLEQIQKHTIKTSAAIQAIKRIATYFLTDYNIIENMIEPTSTAIINAHNPTLMGYTTQEEAMHSISISQQIFESLSDLHQTVEDYIRKANNQLKRREKIIILIKKIEQQQHLCRQAFNNSKERFISSMIAHGSQKVMGNAIKQKCIENNPDLYAREEHTHLDQENSKTLLDIESYMPDEHLRILKHNLKQIESAENITEGTSRLEKTHTAALQPETLLLQYDSSRYQHLKIKLLLELAEDNGLPLLFKTLSHMRSEIHDITAASLHEEITNHINIAKLVGSVANHDPDANNICAQQFFYLSNLIKTRLPEHQKSSFMKTSERLNQQLSQTTSILSILPEYIILILESINTIEKSRLEKVLKNQRGMIQQDMLNLEKKIFFEKEQSNTLNFDATDLWLESLFNDNSNPLTDHEKYSDKAALHAVNFGFLKLLVADNINRNTLADTLFLDYSRLRHMQHIKYQLIIKLISHQTILSIFKQEKIKLDDARIQSTINGSSENLYSGMRNYLKHLSTLLKYDLKSKNTPEEKQNKIVADIAKIISIHSNKKHRLFEIFNKRIQHILKRKIQTGSLDTSILKQPKLKPLMEEFTLTFDNKLTTLVNTHIQSHIERYRQQLSLLQAQEFIHKITHQHFLPNTALPPSIGNPEDFTQLSLRLNKLALLATSMSLTVQFINNRQQTINYTVTDDDISRHIKETRADILFKRQNYTREQIVEHILEYRKLPLLNIKHINLNKIFNFIQKTTIEQCLNDSNKNYNMIAALYIININKMLQSYGISLNHKELFALSENIKSIKPHRHPGFKMYQSACRSILLEFITNKSFKIRHQRKWAALGLFHTTLKQLSTEVHRLFLSTRKIANKNDRRQAQSMIPQQLKTGIR
jgi:hypothetical protein